MKMERKSFYEEIKCLKRKEKKMWFGSFHNIESLHKKFKDIVETTRINDTSVLNTYIYRKKNGTYVVKVNTII